MKISWDEFNSALEGEHIALKLIESDIIEYVDDHGCTTLGAVFADISGTYWKGTYERHPNEGLNPGGDKEVELVRVIEKLVRTWVTL